MATEIERKFLVRNESWRSGADEGRVIRQGYLAGSKAGSVRIRVTGDRATLNIKSATLGIRRLEYDYPLPLRDAEEMLELLCEKPLIEKKRYHVPVAGHVWEVDLFSGANEGLVVAEIELADENETFSLPDWIGEEVSHDPRYYNTCLVSHPYREWRDKLR
ncbi:MAG TPA: CYTH domain-containing protein [Gammaproteobacteria bacterium]|nr:CYTH domain-containing protein [Gammaproteobacteria bacterium]